MTPEEKKELEELKAWKQSLESSNSIPLDIQQSFTDRFLKNLLLSSSKTVASETNSRSVNESGSSSYTITGAAPMDGFKLYNDGGTPIYIPYYL